MEPEAERLSDRLFSSCDIDTLTDHDLDVVLDSDTSNEMVPLLSEGDNVNVLEGELLEVSLSRTFERVALEESDGDHV